MPEKDQEAPENLRALLTLYSSYSTQFAGFSLGLGVVFLALVDVILSPLTSLPFFLSTLVRCLVVGSLFGLIVLAVYLGFIAMYWNRMASFAIQFGIPQFLSLNTTFSLYQLHQDLVAYEYGWIVRLGIGGYFSKVVLVPAAIAFALGFVLAEVVIIHRF